MAHESCNEHKSDFLPSRYFIQKLVDCNERLIKSNHPLSQKIITALGITSYARKRETFRIYNEFLDILGEKNVWGGSHAFVPENDLFYRSMIAEMMKQRA